MRYSDIYNHSETETERGRNGVVLLAMRLCNDVSSESENCTTRLVVLMMRILCVT